MKIRNFTIDRSAKTFRVVDATVNNKTQPTSECIITDLSMVLLEIYSRRKKEVIKFDK